MLKEIKELVPKIMRYIRVWNRDVQCHHSCSLFMDKVVWGMKARVGNAEADMCIDNAKQRLWYGMCSENELCKGGHWILKVYEDMRLIYIQWEGRVIFWEGR